MASKGKPPPPPPLAADSLDDVLRVPPQTPQEYLTHIRALQQRIAGHLRFIGAVGTLAGTSAEAKNLAVARFYERLLAREGQLARVTEELQPR
jgi:hypothetical protein